MSDLTPENEAFLTKIGQVESTKAKAEKPTAKKEEE